MFYTIYKVTNKLDGKIYIGKHQTKNLNDGYMGSGKHLRHAIAKYGIENFEKEILFTFDNETEMNAKEAELVTEEFCLKEDNYNLCPGGKGGWGYIRSEMKNNLSFANEVGKKISMGLLSAYKDGRIRNDGIHNPRYNQKLSEETKQKISLANKGKSAWNKNLKSKKEYKRVSQGIPYEKEKNSQFGTMWITNGVDNKKIKKNDEIPFNWNKGRTCK
jgi:hypothetical protein